MGVLSWIIMGLIAGALAKFILPGDDPGGLIVTILIGIAGGIVGGFVSSLLGFGAIGEFDIWGLFLATAGAIVLLILYRKLKKIKA